MNRSMTELNAQKDKQANKIQNLEKLVSAKKEEI